MEAVSAKALGDIAVALRAYARFVEELHNDLTMAPPFAAPSLAGDAIIKQLRSQGFIASRSGSKKVIELTRDEVTIYVKLDAYRPLIVHPFFERFFSTLNNLSGVIRDKRIVFVHDARLGKFPERNGRQGLEHYGLVHRFHETNQLWGILQPAPHVVISPGTELDGG